MLRPDLSVESGLASPEVGFRRLDELGLLVKLPEQEEPEVDRDDDVSAKNKVSTSNRYFAEGGCGIRGQTYAVTKSWIDQLDSPVTASWVKTFQPLNTTIMTKKTSAAYAVKGWNLELKGLSARVTPWASQALRKPRKAMQMEIQVKREVIVVSCVWVSI